ncbi:SDR family NAD(P)-dependent oxidoreductase [Actinophytocola sp.]|uniref:SDR family NAD(P)-dependent oxidoreductase n=1 Tax=Actinophytocola sp. TaxID=1872138 RepID=UPI002ED01B92
MADTAHLTARYGLDDRVAVVSGASGNIGATCCRELALAGATVVAGYHTGEQAAKLLAEQIEADGGTCVPVAADLSRPDGAQTLVDAALQRFKRVDIAVAAAGVRTRRLALSTDPATVAELLAVNFASAIGLAKACLRPMLRARYGRIILFGSRAGVSGLPGHSVYAATKGALQPWAASVAGELGTHGITVNVIAPGAIRAEQTDFHSEEEQKLVLNFIGAGRFGEPEEVAAAVGFLASSSASYLNGSTVVVDGGARF